MPRGDRQNWGGARMSQRADAKPRGRKAHWVYAEVGAVLLAQLRTLATTQGLTPDALAARWLAERIAAETGAAAPNGHAASALAAPVGKRAGAARSKSTP